jgi:hypothetical protein
MGRASGQARAAREETTAELGEAKPKTCARNVAPAPSDLSLEQTRAPILEPSARRTRPIHSRPAAMKHRGRIRPGRPAGEGSAGASAISAATKKWSRRRETASERQNADYFI